MEAHNRKRIYDIADLCLISFAYGIYKKSPLRLLSLAAYTSSKLYWKEGGEPNRNIDIITIITCWTCIEVSIVCSAYHWYTYNAITASNIALYTIGSSIKDENLATSMHVMLHILSNIGTYIVYDGIDGNGNICTFELDTSRLSILFISIIFIISAIKYGGGTSISKYHTITNKK